MAWTDLWYIQSKVNTQKQLLLQPFNFLGSYIDTQLLHLGENDNSLKNSRVNIARKLLL